MHISCCSGLTHTRNQGISEAYGLCVSILCMTECMKLFVVHIFRLCTCCLTFINALQHAVLYFYINVKSVPVLSCMWRDFLHVAVDSLHINTYRGPPVHAFICMLSVKLSQTNKSICRAMLLLSLLMVVFWLNRNTMQAGLRLAGQHVQINIINMEQRK